VWNLVSGNLGSCVGVAETGTGIQNGPETYQYEFVGVMGHNSISPLMISSQDPKVTQGANGVCLRVAGPE